MPNHVVKGFQPRLMTYTTHPQLAKHYNQVSIFGLLRSSSNISPRFAMTTDFYHPDTPSDIKNAKVN